MPLPRIFPWLTREDYGAFKRLSSADPTLPDTYDDWLRDATQQQATLEATCVTFDKVIIRPDECAAYCRASGINADGVGRQAFASSKARQRRERPT